MLKLPNPSTSVPSSLTNAPIEINELVKAFLAGKNVRTLKAYSQDLADFQTFANLKSIHESARVLLSQGHGRANLILLEYRTHLVERGLQSATVNRRMAAIRSLVRLAQSLGIVDWSLNIQNVKTEAYRDTKGPGKKGFAAMLRTVAEKQSKKSARDTAILRLLYDLALRTGEIVSLNFEDVELSRKLINVVGKGKTTKQQLTLPEPTIAALRVWLQIRGDGAGPLFQNFDRAKKGERLTGVSIYRIVRRLGEVHGLKTRPHGVRHTAITEACKVAAENGIGLEEVLDFSRHSRSSIGVLVIYRDRERNIQGQLASCIAAEISLNDVVTKSLNHGGQNLSADPTS